MHFNELPSESHLFSVSFALSPSPFAAANSRSWAMTQDQR